MELFDQSAWAELEQLRIWQSAAFRGLQVLTVLNVITILVLFGLILSWIFQVTATLNIFMVLACVLELALLTLVYRGIFGTKIDVGCYRR